jgi:hypothetical protein
VDGFKTYSALGPGQELSVTLGRECDSLINEVLKGRVSPDNVILITGTVIYCTIFNRDHRTDFAFYCQPKGGPRFQRPPSNMKAFWTLPIDNPQEHSQLFSSPWDDA